MDFDSVDLSTYGLTEKISTPIPIIPPTKHEEVQVGHRAYEFSSYLGAKIISVDVSVTGASEAGLKSNLDAIAKLLNPQRGTKHLILDFMDDRYFNAKVSEPVLLGIITTKLAEGAIVFVCPNPCAYANAETESEYAIDADPKTVNETSGGTGYAHPVFRLPPAAASRKTG